jgi:hypothetical protein
VSSKKKAEGKFSKADQRKLASQSRDADGDDLQIGGGAGAKGGKGSDFMDAKMSKKIMSQAQAQREEESEAAMALDTCTSTATRSKGAAKKGVGASLLSAPSMGGGGDSDDSESEEEPNGLGFGEDDGGIGEEYGEDEEYEVREVVRCDRLWRFASFCIALNLHRPKCPAPLVKSIIETLDKYNQCDVLKCLMCRTTRMLHPSSISSS